MQSYDSIIAGRRADVQTVSDPPDADVPWVDFFNTVDFFDVQRDSGRAFYFQLQEKSMKRSLCVAHFTEKEPGLFASPRRGTYGGIDCAESDVALFDIFLEDMERELRTAGAETMQMSLAPDIHDLKRSSLLMNALLRRGFVITKQEVNYYLTVDSTPLLNKMERNNRKRVRKCEREQCAFVEFNAPADFERAYAVINKNRTTKGYPMTMTLEHLLQMKKQFPDRWLSFGVTQGSALVATSICIRLNPKILYVFYWGDLPEMGTLSPIAFLADNLYAFCQKAGIALLDIGTATDNGIPNVGLMTFKERLGCKSCLKLTLSKSLS